VVFWLTPGELPLTLMFRRIRSILVFLDKAGPSPVLLQALAALILTVIRPKMN
jgi:hypothetical protein